MASYMGHTLSCDSSLVSGVQASFNNAGTTVQTKAGQIKSELQALIDYAYSDPTVGTSLQATAVDNAVEAVNEAISTALSQLNNIINAITDYSDGNWSDANNKLFLDNFLGIKSPRSPSSPGGDGPSTPPTQQQPAQNENPTITDEILESIESDIIVNPYTDTPTTTPKTDVELISQQAEINEDYFAPGAFSTTVSSGTGELLEFSESNITEETITPGQLSSSASSIGSNFDFSIPSPAIGNIKEVKNSGVIGTVGLAAAAALALGGKVAYDRNVEKGNISSETYENIDETDEEEDDNEDINETHIQTGADVINEVDSNIVKFKEEIFRIGLDNDAE